MDVQRKNVKLDRAALERYIALEQCIHEEESKNTLKAMALKDEQCTDIDATVKSKQMSFDQAVKNTEKEKSDVDKMANPSVQAMFADKSSFDKQMSQEQEEYMDAVNKQEIAKKELEGAKATQVAVKTELDTLKKEAESINKLYKEQDELLAAIFNGAYGSSDEYKLETELDLLLENKQKIQVAHYKWTNAKVLLNHGVNQLLQGVKKWEQTTKVPITDRQQKYLHATEARNNLIAASQNLKSCQKYLSNIAFPYVKPQEVTTLDKAVEHIYTDMQTPDRAAHAMQCYSVTQKRAAALLQWFDNVIKTTITTDLSSATNKANAVEMALRQERLKLIKEKITASDGSANVSNVKGENELGKESLGGNDVTVISAGMENVSVSKADDRAAAGTPLPLSDLAPAPSGAELFGAIDNIKQEHQQAQAELEKTQAVNKARMEQGLQERLNARRSRQSRMA